MDKKLLFPLPRNMPSRKNYIIGYPKVMDNMNNMMNTNTLYQAWIYFRLQNKVYLKYFKQLDSNIEDKLVDASQLNRYLEMYRSIEPIFEHFIQTLLIQQAQPDSEDQKEKIIMLNFWFNKHSEDRFIICKTRNNLVTMVLPTSKKQVGIMNDMLFKKDVFGQKTFIEMYALT